MKVLSIAIPCYNSEAYMKRAISTLLTGGDDVEILIVDDGSKDKTAQIADATQRNIRRSSRRFTRRTAVTGRRSMLGCATRQVPTSRLWTAMTG